MSGIFSPQAKQPNRVKVYCDALNVYTIQYQTYSAGMPGYVTGLTKFGTGNVQLQFELASAGCLFQISLLANSTAVGLVESFPKLVFAGTTQITVYIFNHAGANVDSSSFYIDIWPI